MATLTVLKFTTELGADNALGIIQELATQQLITLHDAAVVIWPLGNKKPKTKHLHNLAGRGALDGAFWGLLFGVIFFVPLFGAAVGAALGAWRGSLAKFGIDDEFIKSVQDQITEGTSALFLMTSDAVVDKVTDRLKKIDFKLIASNLSQEEEDHLRETFAW